MNAIKRFCLVAALLCVSFSPSVAAAAQQALFFPASCWHGVAPTSCAQQHRAAATPAPGSVFGTSIQAPRKKIPSRAPTWYVLMSFSGLGGVGTKYSRKLRGR